MEALKVVLTGDELTSGRGFPALGDAGEPFQVLETPFAVKSVWEE